MSPDPSYSRLGKRRNAIAVMEKILCYNPDDNQGVRFLIGSEYLRAKQEKKAQSFFEALAFSYPSYHYELALLCLKHNDWRSALTNLRRGFIANSYIAEILCGSENPILKVLWHDSNYAEPDFARQYVSNYGELWHIIPFAIHFVHWAYTHPKILAEKAAIFQFKEELLWEREFEKRHILVSNVGTAIEKIDDTLSAELIQRRSCRDIQDIYPWMYPVFKFSNYFT